MPLNVRFNFNDIRYIAAAKERSQRELMDHTQPQQLINTKKSKKGLPTSMFGDTSDVPYT